MEQQVITRSMFCKNCFADKRPNRGDYYVMATPEGFTVFKDYKSHMGSEKGLTPHCITLVSKKQNKVTLQVHCAMNGCGVRIEMDEYGIPTMYDSLNRETILFEGKFYTKIDGYWDEVPDDTLVKNKVFVLTSRVKIMTKTTRQWKFLKKYTFKLL